MCITSRERRDESSLIDTYLSNILRSKLKQITMVGVGRTLNAQDFLKNLRHPLADAENKMKESAIAGRFDKPLLSIRGLQIAVFFRKPCKFLRSFALQPSNFNLKKTLFSLLTTVGSNIIGYAFHHRI